MNLTSEPKIPHRAVVISLLAFIVPVGAPQFAPDTVAQYEMLLWLLALVPPFLLAYYRGWRGVAAALAAGMAILSIVQVLAPVSRMPVTATIPLLGLLAAYVAIALGVGWLSELLHREREKAERLALTDDLTDMPNRRYARLFLETEFAAAQRGRPLTLALFDLDRFKEYNDQYGHAAGDEALRVMATALRTHTRRMNLSARYGGEEFVSIVSAADVTGALAFVERVRRALEGLEVRGGPLSVSVGVAAFHEGMHSAEDLLIAADHALYQAKRAGRNQVRVFGERDEEDEERGGRRSGQRDEGAGADRGGSRRTDRDATAPAFGQAEPVAGAVAAERT